METRSNDLLDTQSSATTPDDVAALFSWANVQGAPYRDFSASRREQRAQLRLRTAEQAREVELTAEMEAKAAAGHAETLAEQAVAFIQSTPSTEARERTGDLARASLLAEEADRLAAAERIEAARRAEAAAQASLVAEQSQREVAEAAVSARRQELLYEQASTRSSAPELPGEISDPYVPTPVVTSTATDAGPDRRSADDGRASGISAAASASTSRLDTPSRRREDSQPAGSETPRPEILLSPVSASEYLDATSSTNRRIRPSSWTPSLEELSPERDTTRNTAREIARATPVAVPSPAPVQAPAHPASITPPRRQDPSRWFTLNDVFLQPSRIDPTLAISGADLQLPPVLAVFSLAGGVGRTSLVASLGRCLSSLGERVLLSDLSAYGMLPFFFGARELQPGLVRTFRPPTGSTDLPVSLVTYDAGQGGTWEAQDACLRNLTKASRGVHRLLLDLNAASGWLLRRVSTTPLTVLVPLTPDMNSVISLSGVERLLASSAAFSGRPVNAFFLLNQFDASSQLHLDTREALRGRLGDRLLPFEIGRSPHISEALAEGMTVLDYAPETPVAEELLGLANWVRSLAAPAAAQVGSARWSEL